MKKSESNRKIRRAIPIKGDRFEIRFSGSGGQGIITAAVIFAEAVAIHGKYHVCQTQSYGPEARGGTSKADVVISPESVDYPKAERLDILVAMNQTGCDAHYQHLKPHGLLIADATLVTQIPVLRALSLPFSEIALQVTGKKLAANVVAVGALAGIIEMPPVHPLRRVIQNRVPNGTEKINLKAFDAGRKAAHKLDLNDLPETISHDEDEP